MSTLRPSYHYLSITGWFFILAVLFTSDGYCRYTDSLSTNQGIEVLDIAVEKSTRSVSFIKALTKCSISQSTFKRQDSFDLLNNFHTNATLLLFKKYTPFIAIYCTQHLVRTYHSQYFSISDEDTVLSRIG